jgi:hypothetical protein
MRYADGRGLTSEGRSRRELVRLQAAGIFAHGAGAARRPGAAGQYEVGLPEAAVAVRRRGSARVEGPRRQSVQAG